MTLSKRDIYECANQLRGYIGPDTDKFLAEFLWREGNAAAELADEITRLTAENERLRKALATVVREYDECSGAEPSLSALFRAIDTTARAALEQP